MNWIPVGGFLVALALTTVWFDRLEAERDNVETATCVLLQMVYATTWGLLGAAVILLCAMSAPDMVPTTLTIIGCVMAMMAGKDAVTSALNRGGIKLRDLRWLLSGLVIFGSTSVVLQDLNSTSTKQALRTHVRFADLPKADFQ